MILFMPLIKELCNRLETILVMQENFLHHTQPFLKFVRTN